MASNDQDIKHIMEKDKTRGSGNAATGTSTAANIYQYDTSTAPSATLTSPTKKQPQKADDLSCILCFQYSEKTEILLAEPCGHSCFCKNCYEKLPKKVCPTCNIPIEKVVPNRNFDELLKLVREAEEIDLALENRDLKKIKDELLLQQALVLHRYQKTEKSLTEQIAHLKKEVDTANDKLAQQNMAFGQQRLLETNHDQQIEALKQEKQALDEKLKKMVAARNQRKHEMMELTKANRTLSDLNEKQAAIIKQQETFQQNQDKLTEQLKAEQREKEQLLKDKEQLLNEKEQLQRELAALRTQGPKDVKEQADVTFQDVRSAASSVVKEPTLMDVTPTPVPLFHSMPVEKESAAAVSTENRSKEKEEAEKLSKNKSNIESYQKLSSILKKIISAGKAEKIKKYEQLAEVLQQIARLSNEEKKLAYQTLYQSGFHKQHPQKLIGFNENDFDLEAAIPIKLGLLFLQAIKSSLSATFFKILLKSREVMNVITSNVDENIPPILPMDKLVFLFIKITERNKEIISFLKNDNNYAHVGRSFWNRVKLFSLVQQLNFDFIEQQIQAGPPPFPRDLINILIDIENSGYDPTYSLYDLLVEVLENIAKLSEQGKKWHFQRSKKNIDLLLEGVEHAEGKDLDKIIVNKLSDMFLQTIKASDSIFFKSILTSQEAISGLTSNLTEDLPPIISKAQFIYLLIEAIDKEPDLIPFLKNNKDYAHLGKDFWEVLKHADEKIKSKATQEKVAVPLPSVQAVAPTVGITTSTLVNVTPAPFSIKEKEPTALEINVNKDKEKTPALINATTKTSIDPTLTVVKPDPSGTTAKETLNKESNEPKNLMDILKRLKNPKQPLMHPEDQEGAYYKLLSAINKLSNEDNKLAYEEFIHCFIAYPEFLAYPFVNPEMSLPIDIRTLFKQALNSTTSSDIFKILLKSENAIKAATSLGPIPLIRMDYLIFHLGKAIEKDPNLISVLKNSKDYAHLDKDYWNMFELRTIAHKSAYAELMAILIEAEKINYKIHDGYYYIFSQLLDALNKITKLNVEEGERDYQVLVQTIYRTSKDTDIGTTENKNQAEKVIVELSGLVTRLIKSSGSSVLKPLLHSEVISAFTSPVIIMSKEVMAILVNEANEKDPTLIPFLKNYPNYAHLTQGFWDIVSVSRLKLYFEKVANSFIIDYTSKHKPIMDILDIKICFKFKSDIQLDINILNSSFLKQIKDMFSDSNKKKADEYQNQLYLLVHKETATVFLQSSTIPANTRIDFTTLPHLLRKERIQMLDGLLLYIVSSDGSVNSSPYKTIKEAILNQIAPLPNEAEPKRFISAMDQIHPLPTRMQEQPVLVAPLPRFVSFSAQEASIPNINKAKELEQSVSITAQGTSKPRKN